MSIDDCAEREWIARIAKGDRSALQLLHQAYYPRLIRFFGHLQSSANLESLEHLIERTLLGVWLSLGPCLIADSVYIWIMGLALKQAQDVSSVMHPEPEGFVYALFAPLSIEERAVVHFVCTGHACQEIAQIMSVSCEQVNALLSRARTGMNQSGRTLTAQSNGHSLSAGGRQ